MSHLSAFNAAARATAEVSEPPRPNVVISPSSVTPWNPATTIIFPSSRFFLNLSVLISIILALEWTFSVKIPICVALKLTALYPWAWIAIVRSAIDTHSPVDKSISISLAEGFGFKSFAIFTRWSVVCPIADTTTTTSFPFSFSLMTVFATFLILSVSATDVPPNFWTITFLNLIISLYIY